MAVAFLVVYLLFLFFLYVCFFAFCTFYTRSHTKRWLNGSLLWQYHQNNYDTHKSPFPPPQKQIFSLPNTTYSLRHPLRKEWRTQRKRNTNVISCRQAQRQKKRIKAQENEQRNVFGVTENKIQSILQGEEDPSQTEMSMDMCFI